MNQTKRIFKTKISPALINRALTRIEPSAYELSEDDITQDVERVIAKAVSPYVDESNPMLQFDELQGECRAKLAKILHNGCLSKCPTREKVFAYLKTSFRNHVRSLVQKYAYATKRTGRPTAQTSIGSATLDFKPGKPCHISLNDPELDFQLGRDDDSFKRREFLEELGAALTPEETQVFDYLLSERVRGTGANITADVEDQRSSREYGDRFLKLRASIRQKCRAILMSSSKADTASPVTSDQNRSGSLPVESVGSGSIVGTHFCERASESGNEPNPKDEITKAASQPPQDSADSDKSTPMRSSQVRDVVVSFRVPKQDFERLHRVLLAKPLVGVRSVNQFARRIVLDCISDAP